jgi:hypothetical protein
LFDHQIITNSLYQNINYLKTDVNSRDKKSKINHIVGKNYSFSHDCSLTESNLGPNQHCQVETCITDFLWEIENETQAHVLPSFQPGS